MTGPEGRSARPQPDALAGWADQLARLDPDVAEAVAALLPPVDELFARHTATPAPGWSAELDGFDALTRRGTPEHLLMSEWLLAEEVPEEFQRRAATGELGYLRLHRARRPATGRIVLLLDTGPTQLGAPRLVHLAAIVALARRAAADGWSLAAGLLHRPGHWLPDDLPGLVQAWLAGRTHRAPDVAGWQQVLHTVPDVYRADSTDHVELANGPEPGLRHAATLWLVGGADIDRDADDAVPSGTQPGPSSRSPVVRPHLVRPHLIRVEQLGYPGNDVVDLALKLDDDRVQLSVPITSAAVRLLTGTRPAVGAAPAQRSSEPVIPPAPSETGSDD